MELERMTSLKSNSYPLGILLSMPESHLQIIYKQDIQTELFLKIVDLVSENIEEENVKDWASMYL